MTITVCIICNDFVAIRMEMSFRRWGDFLKPIYQYIMEVYSFYTWNSQLGHRISLLSFNITLIPAPLYSTCLTLHQPDLHHLYASPSGLDDLQHRVRTGLAQGHHVRAVWKLPRQPGPLVDGAPHPRGAGGASRRTGAHRESVLLMFRSADALAV